MPVHTQGSLLGGRYRVVRHLGSGGMASVLLCQDERLDRQVAVKRLHADSPADVEQRFAREAKVGASLNHPNLVSVFDTATDDENVFIVMEYVDGEALARTLKRGPLEPDRVAAMVRDVGAALDHVHAHGVVHRDVKPGNVLLRRDGVAKLVDLGIATAQDHTRLTHSGMVLGTAAYMAPEQLEGGETTPATDIYALAVVAYESLTGRRAPRGAHADGDRASHRHQPATRPARRAAERTAAGRRAPEARDGARPTRPPGVGGRAGRRLGARSGGAADGPHPRGAAHAPGRPARRGTSPSGRPRGPPRHRRLRLRPAPRERAAAPAPSGR